MKSFLKKSARLANRLTFGWFRNNHVAWIGAYGKFWSDFRAYRKISHDEKIRIADLQPCITDATGASPINHHYFYQDTWCARKVFQHRPERHIDVGSTVLLVGILSQFVPTINVDIRPLDVDLPGLEFREGNVCAMPFGDASVASLSSICVIEHIGLGRYGDPLDPQGTEKAISEFQRILAPGGNLYVSVPVGREEKVFFNANRVFIPDEFVKRFSQCSVSERGYIQGRNVFGPHEEDKIDWNHEAIGFFHFVKR